MAEGTIHPISDAGRRMSEAYTAAVATGGAGRWLAVSLADGKPVGADTSRPDVFDTRADAVRHASEDRHAFVQLGPLAMPPAEATAWIALHRKTWEAGFRFTDPGTPTPIPSLAPDPFARPAPGLRPSGLIIPELGHLPSVRRRRR